MTEIKQISTVWQVYCHPETPTGVNVVDAVVEMLRHQPNVSAEDIAIRYDVPQNWLSTSMTIYLGVTLSQMILHWRNYVALDMLDDANNTYEAIAKRCGYRSERAFCNAFARTFGITPYYYRNEQTQQHPRYLANTKQARQAMLDKAIELKARYQK